MQFVTNVLKQLSGMWIISDWLITRESSSTISSGVCVCVCWHLLIQLDRLGWNYSIPSLHLSAGELGGTRWQNASWGRDKDVRSETAVLPGYVTTSAYVTVFTAPLFPHYKMQIPQSHSNLYGHNTWIFSPSLKCQNCVFTVAGTERLIMSLQFVPMCLYPG